MINDSVIIDKCKFCESKATAYLHTWAMCQKCLKFHKDKDKTKYCKMCADHLGVTFEEEE